jgi:hypothetical protein
VSGNVHIGSIFYRKISKGKDAMMRWKNLARLLIGSVIIWNLQCAFLFIVKPEQYVGGFEVSGVSGIAMLRGFGVLFIMWNVPYVFAVLDPLRYYNAYFQSFLMQAIGLIGETIVRVTIPDGYLVLKGSIDRFIGFDALGLFFIGLGLLVLKVKFQMLRGMHNQVDKDQLSEK